MGELTGPTRPSAAHTREAPHIRRIDPADDEVVRNLVRALVRRVSEVVGPEKDDRGPLLDHTELGWRCLLLLTTPQGHKTLSPRENEIAGMVGRGYTNRAIATELEISLYTVSAHMRRIFIKLGVGTRAAMVAALAENPEPRFAGKVSPPVVPLSQARSATFTRRRAGHLAPDDQVTPRSVSV